MDFLKTLPTEDVEEEVFEGQDTGDTTKVGSEDDIIQAAIIAAEEMAINAREKAQHIMEAARQEGEKQGKAEGFDAGYAEGMKKAENEMERRLNEERQLIASEVAADIKAFSDEREKMIEYYIDDLKEIALAIGEKIVQTSLRSSAEVVERMIIKATEKMKKVGWAKIYIGGSGVGSEIQGDTDFLKSLSHIANNVKIVIIDEDEPGTCIVETPEGILDISIKTQLENIKEILNNARL